MNLLFTVNIAPNRSDPPATAANTAADINPLFAHQPCTLMDMPHIWDEEHWYVTFTGPVYAGKYFSEWFLLNYLNGMEVAWGELT